MTPREVLLKLAELDQHTARWSEQWQRDGLFAYKQRLSDQQARLDALQSRQTELEDEVSRRQASLEDLETQIAQFQREVDQCNGYEASVLKNRLLPLHQHKAQQEETLLQVMLELEELQPQLAPLQVEIEETRQELIDAQADEHERIDGLCRRLEQAHAQRELLAAQVNEVYELYRTKGLKEFKSGRCPACRLEIPDQVQRRLRQDEGVPCPTCQVVLIKP